MSLSSIISLALMAFGILWLIPRPTLRARWVGYGCLVLGIIGVLGLLNVPESPLVENIQFWLFGGSALLFAALTITHHKPVYAALWFALATLASCGLLLMQSAPFLAAATIIVYAGAIVVTFVFVIMLAQQAGTTGYDRRPRKPALAVISAFVLFGAILTVLERSSAPVIAATDADVAPTPAAAEPTVAVNAEVTNALSHPREGESLGTMHGLGRALFGDYLFSVELAGTLLLIASIGAITIAPRRGQGTL